MAHLSNKQIKNIFQGNAEGVNLTSALIHVEECSHCRSKIPFLQKTQVMDLILQDPISKKKVELELPTTRTTKPDWKNSFWNWQNPVFSYSFAALLILLFGGIGFWIFNNNQSTKDVVSLPVNQAVEKPKNEVSNVAENTPFENIASQNTNTNQSEENTLPKNREIVVPQPTPNKENEIDINSLDQREMAVNLNKLPPSLADLRSSETILRNENTEKINFSAKYPNGEIIRETQPVFKWSSVKNASSYKVTVYDENLNEIFSKEVSGTNSKVETQLQRGEKYLWQVTANVNDNGKSSTITLPPTTFRIAKTETINQVDKLKNSSQWKKVNSLFRAGLLVEAEAAVNEILRKNPKDKSALKMLNRIKTIRKNNQRTPTVTKPAQ